MSDIALDAPQLGEHVWHAFTADPGIEPESRAHAARIEAVVTAHCPDLDWSRARMLEIGAYRHFSSDMLAARGVEAVATDISAAALRDGRRQAQVHDVKARAKTVVADFHDFPFSTGYFDLVFVASSVHHTRRPEVVLRELMRVLAPGGVLVLANEPCARLCCFHAFSCNRADSLTAFERAMNDAGLLPTLSSPFWGARPENLFGMVENDRIPLSLYMEVFDECGTVLERDLLHHGLIGPFEERLLALSGTGPSLRAEVTQILREAVAVAQARYGALERRLEYRVPTECEVHGLAGTLGAMIERRPEDDRDWRVEMFGAALSAVVRKQSQGERSQELFRRPMLFEPDGLAREAPDSGALAVQLAGAVLPEIHACDTFEPLEPWFRTADWQWEVSPEGVHSILNRGLRSHVDIAPGPRRILLIRYFAVVTEGESYRVRIWGAGRMLAEQAVILQESRLFRTIVPEGCDEIVVEIDPDPAFAEEHAGQWIPRIKVGVFQLIDALRDPRT